MPLHAQPLHALRSRTGANAASSRKACASGPLVLRERPRGEGGALLAWRSGMPISGLVIRLAEKRVELPSQIAGDVRLTLGDLQERCFLPAVLETSTLQESEAVVEGLLARDGILGVDIVTVDFSDNVHPTPEAP